MKKKFDEYKLYVFDLDGTLYFQKHLRMIMLKRLLLYYGLHLWRFKELLILKRFREVRDNWEEVSKTADDKLQYEFVAKGFKTDADTVKAVVIRWIYDNPLDAVAKTKDKKLADIIRNLRPDKKVVIFSDYPVEDKLRALEIEADGAYFAGDSRINELKPSPKGLEVIMQDFGVPAEDVLMIGDRYEKDGLSAEKAGIDYLILERSSSKRESQYSVMS